MMQVVRTFLAAPPRSFASISRCFLRSVSVRTHTTPVPDGTFAINMEANRGTPLESEMSCFFRARDARKYFFSFIFDEGGRKWMSGEENGKGNNWLAFSTLNMHEMRMIDTPRAQHGARLSRMAEHKAVRCHSLSHSSDARFYDHSHVNFNP